MGRDRHRREERRKEESGLRHFLAVCYFFSSEIWQCWAERSLKSLLDTLICFSVLKKRAGAGHFGNPGDARGQGVITQSWAKTVSTRDWKKFPGNDDSRKVSSLERGQDGSTTEFLGIGVEQVARGCPGTLR